jgi:arylsulfatase A-like enzyme
MVKLSILGLMPLAVLAAKKPVQTVAKDSLAKPVTMPMSAAFDSTTATAADGAPNIIVFMVDDLGYSDVAFMAKTDEEMESMDVAKATPTLSALASNGVVLGSFYVSPTCTPSRASFLTGRYPTSIGLQDSVIHATEPRGVSLDFDLLPSKLNEAGYNTMGVGKWHLGFHQPQYLPTRRGFQEYFGILTGGGGHFTHQSTGSFTLRGEYKAHTVDMVGYNLWHNGDPVSDYDRLVQNRHTTAIYTDVAIAQLKASYKSNPTTPFFLYLSFQAIHAPMEVESKYIDGTIDNGCNLIAYDETLGNNRKKLCGMMNELDDSANSILGHLISTDQWKNTLFTFVSDNGGIESHGSSNYPFKGGKGSYYEGGIRVPAFLGGGYMESSLSNNQVKPYRTNSLFHISDLHATFLSLAQVPYTTTATIGDEAITSKLDGVNQWDFIVNGGETSNDESVTAFIPRKDILHNMNTLAFGAGGALRMGNYKLIVEAKVADSEVYTYAQHVLQDGDFSSEELAMVIGSKLLKGSGTFRIFNIAKNPTERDDSDCDDLEECDSLYGVEDYKQVEIALMDKWKEYSEKSGPSSLEWLDDGPLTDPALFGGFWVPWRDEEGLPYATYSALATSTREFGPGDSDSEKGDGDGTGDKTWKLTSDQKEEMKESHAVLGVKQDTREMLVQTSSSSEQQSTSGSGVGHPYVLLSSGAVLGAVVAVVAMSHMNKKTFSKFKYSPV